MSQKPLPLVLECAAGAKTVAAAAGWAHGRAWKRPGRRKDRGRSHTAAPVRRRRPLVALLQHLAKHNAFHGPVENAAEDIADRRFITESRAGIIIAALAKFGARLLDFDAPCRDLA